MNISSIINSLETFAPLGYQESYDNCGLLTGNANWQCTGVLCTLDCIEQVVDEAIAKSCNLIVAHHPIIFSGLKKITGKTYIEQTIIKAIKNDIAIYAIHTNLDNVKLGVNKKFADKIGLIHQKILSPKFNALTKFFVYVPLNHLDVVKQAIFATGAGQIGNYSHCSFATTGKGSYMPLEGSTAFEGIINKTSNVEEIKLEVLCATHSVNRVLDAIKNVHPYEEVAYEMIALANKNEDVGSGLLGELPSEMPTKDFLALLKYNFCLQFIKHTAITKKTVKTIAICGGAGSFLINQAIAAKADVYISSDIKYHEFFDAENKIVIADLGHFETEQFTPELLVEILQLNFPTFAIQKSVVNTNPVQYF
jgi:dinuclear metal center YbgI/SA1388 family protein